MASRVVVADNDVNREVMIDVYGRPVTANFNRPYFNRPNFNRPWVKMNKRWGLFAFEGKFYKFPKVSTGF
jgi:hypothetical protein